MAEICQRTAESSWHLFRIRLHPRFKLTGRQRHINATFVHLTAAYGDVLDSLGRLDENEAFWRSVLEDIQKGFTISPYLTRLEMHLIYALRRSGNYLEALNRLERIRDELHNNYSSWSSPSTPPTSATNQLHQRRPYEEDTPILVHHTAMTELKYEVLSVHGLCEVEGGDAKNGRAILREAFELMEKTYGTDSPRTTRALRDCVQCCGDPDRQLELMNGLGERLARSLEPIPNPEGWILSPEISKITSGNVHSPK